MIPVISPNYFMQKASYMQAKLIADTIRQAKLIADTIRKKIINLYGYMMQMKWEKP